MKSIVWAICTLFFVLSFFGDLQNAQAENEMVFQKQSGMDKSHSEIVYSVKSDNCTIAWYVAGYSDVGYTGLDEKSLCNLPIKQQAAYRNKLLDQVTKDLKPGLPLRNFVFGSMNRGDATSLFSDRLAQAVIRSKGWDGKHLRPINRSETMTHFVLRMLNEEHVFRELEEIFKHHGYIMKVTDAEEILTKDIDGAPRVPFSAFVVIRLEKQ